MKNRFNLEADIMNCWQVTDDIDTICKMLGDHEMFDGMKPQHQDRLMNVLLGLHALYDMKFTQLWYTFETLVRQGELK